MKCEDIRNYFSEYIDNEATPEIAEAVEAHILECPACCNELAKYRAFVGSLGAAMDEELPPDFNTRLHERLEQEGKKRQRNKTRRVWVRALAGAACLLLVVGAVGVFSNLGGDKYEYAADTPAAAPSFYNSAAGYAEDEIAWEQEMAMPMEAPAPEPSMDMYGAENDMVTAEAGARNTNKAAQAAVERKIIRNCYLSLLVDDFDAAFSAIEALATAYGGYVVSGEQNDYEGAIQRNGFISIRVDAMRLDAALDEIETLGTVESNNFSSNDVTADYYDTELRLEQYRNQAERLNEFYDRAETIEDLISIESELSRVLAEIDSLEGALRYYDQLTALSLIDIHLYTPSTYTQVVEPQGWAALIQDIQEGFLNGLNGALDFLAKALVALTSILPGLILLALAAAAVFLIVRAIVRRKRKK